MSSRRGVRPGWVVLPALLLLILGGASWLATAGGEDAGTASRDEAALRSPNGHDGSQTRREGGARCGRRSSADVRGADPTRASDPVPVVDDLGWELSTGTTSEPAPEAGATNAAEAEALRRLRDEAAAKTRPRRSGTIGIGGGVSGRRGGPTRRDGRVVDSQTGEPVTDAEILVLRVFPDGRVIRWHGAMPAADGTFSSRLTRRAGEETVLAVRAPGYHTERLDVADAPATWEIHRSASNGRGDLRGRAHTDSGEGLAGMLLVELQSDLGDRLHAYAWSDAAGRFRIRGLHAARWRARLHSDADWSEADVPEGGEGVVDLVGFRPAAAPPERPGSDRRAVRVTGPPEGAVVRAEMGRDVAWLAVVEGGAATLELPYGLWVLRRDARHAEAEALTVERGAGPQDFELTK